MRCLEPNMLTMCTHLEKIKTKLSSRYTILSCMCRIRCWRKSIKFSWKKFTNSLVRNMLKLKNLRWQLGGNIYWGKFRRQEKILHLRGNKDLNSKEKLLNLLNPLATDWSKSKSKRSDRKKRKSRDSLCKYWGMSRDNFGEVLLRFVR